MGWREVGGDGRGCLLGRLSSWKCVNGYGRGGIILNAVVGRSCY